MLLPMLRWLLPEPCSDRFAIAAGRPLMVAPTGQRLIAASLPEDPVEIICGTCFFLADDVESVNLAGSPQEHIAELATIRPNLHRNRN